MVTDLLTKFVAQRVICFSYLIGDRYWRSLKKEEHGYMYEVRKSHHETLEPVKKKRSLHHFIDIFFSYD